MRIGEFTYSDDGSRLFNIKYNQSSHPMPPTFFKYYALSSNGIDALTKSYIYASHPNQMNDPFDCDKDMITIDDNETLKVLLGNLYQEIKDSLGSQEFATFLSLAFNTLVYKKCGILSLTTNPTNSLMWAHYAGKNGVCVEFNIQDFPFNFYGPFPINYVETLPIVKTSLIGLKQAMAIQCTVKQSIWSYEDEWRILIPNQGGIDMKSYGYWSENINTEDDHDRKFAYPTKAIKRVILGCEFVAPRDVKKLSNNVILTTTLSEEKCRLLEHIEKHNILTSILHKCGGGHYDTIDVAIEKRDNQSFIISEL